MHLEQHARIELRPAKSGRHSYHCPLYDVGGGALDRRVDGSTFHEATPRRVLIHDPRHMATPPEKRRHIALSPRRFLGSLHVVANAGISDEIGIDVALGLALRNSQLLAQPKGRNAIDDPEI